jgi:hypothetical protein
MCRACLEGRVVRQPLAIEAKAGALAADRGLLRYYHPRLLPYYYHRRDWQFAPVANPDRYSPL